MVMDFRVQHRAVWTGRARYGLGTQIPKIPMEAVERMGRTCSSSLGCFQGQRVNNSIARCNFEFVVHGTPRILSRKVALLIFNHWVIIAIKPRCTYLHLTHMFRVFYLFNACVFFALPWSFCLRNFSFLCVFHHKSSSFRSWVNLPSTLRSNSWMLSTCCNLTLRGSKGWWEGLLVNPYCTLLPHISANDIKVNN